MNYPNQRFMYKQITLLLILFIPIILAFNACEQVQGQEEKQERMTAISIVGEQFYINGAPTYKGRTWTASDGQEYSVEGLLMNARLVQGIFDDLNPKTRGQWVYPDTKQWDPERNTREFIEAMASWREHGLLAFTLNLQGGCPYGYCRDQPWDNSAFAPDGSLREGFMNRLERIIDRADELGMVVILGYFYFGQDGKLKDESAVIQAVENATEWVLGKGYTNVIVELNNECSHSQHQRYSHDILWCNRVHELINIVKGTEIDGRSLYVSTSLSGGQVPPANIIKNSDFVFLHGNGVQDPERIVQMVREVRAMDVYTPMPIVNNEDDQPWRADEQSWENDENNFVTSVKNYASWGYFDFRRGHERNDFNQGFQSVPVNSHITSERKREFFDLLAEITGSPGTPKVQLDWSQEIGEKVSVSIEEEPYNAAIEQVELLVNNEVIATMRDRPFEFSLDEYGYEIPSGEHWIRARATYYNDDRKIVVESPYYKDPWWPYGGPAPGSD